MNSSTQSLLFCLISKVGDWTIRIDAPHGSAKHHRKHVHINKRGLEGEYSWNSDGTRHDAHRFPTSEKCIGAARRHAASALNVPASSLSFIVSVPGGVRVAVGTNPMGSKRFSRSLSTYVKLDNSLVVFGFELGIVLVLTNDA